MTQHLEDRRVTTTVRGRYLLRLPVAPSRGLLVGFHGYAETADIQLARLSELSAADAWTLVSIQALHPFYRGRSEEVVANWMTRADRALAIEDNVAYVDRVLDDVTRYRPAAVIVCAGFSQGAAMAYRAALRGNHRCAGVIAVGGDLPPELEAIDATRWQHLRVVVARGALDDWFTQAKMDADVAWLASRVASVDPVVVDAGHEWTPALNAGVARLLAAVTVADPRQPPRRPRDHG